MAGLGREKIEQFDSRGFPVVENVLDTGTPAAPRAEYETLTGRLYGGWASRAALLRLRTNHRGQNHQC